MFAKSSAGSAPVDANTNNNSNSNTTSSSINTTSPTPRTSNPKHYDATADANKGSPSLPKSPRLSLRGMGGDDDNLPNNVSSPHQLASLPEECLSDNKQRPLRHVDDQGNEFFYSLNPMLFSVAFILVVELLERFSFYGIYYTQTLYLTGVYNEEWNAGLSSVDAASLVSLSTMVAYSTPFIGAVLADAKLGDYWSITLGACLLYLPGVLLVALTAVPYFLGTTFNMTALTVAILVLWPLGTGIVKSVVNVFGAKQFHPLFQASMIEQYYVNFYMSINIGALAGITLVPILAQHDVVKAYFLPVGLLALGILIFISGTPRYVISKPRGDLFLSAKKDEYRDPNLPPPIPLSQVFRVSVLIVPFCIAYNQMPTTFIVQGTVMTKAFGFIDAATMNSLDAVSVLVFGSITGNVIYPALAKRNIKLPTTYKFALGSCLGALAIAWALLVEHWIHAEYHATGAKISVLWQAPSYILIGWGEIFAVSAAYEAAFTASSPETKALASAINIFCVGGIPNIICIALFQACQGWFRNSTYGDTNLTSLDDYATAHVYKYFCVLFLILLLGVGLNLFPRVRQFVDDTEQQAAELVKTPILRKPTPKLKRKKKPVLDRDATESESFAFADEEAQSPTISERTSLLKAQLHQQYLKYGKGPVLYKMGSMRAGPTLSHKESKKNPVKKSVIHNLYGGSHAAAGGGRHATTATSTLMPPANSRKKMGLKHQAESR